MADAGTLPVVGTFQTDADAYPTSPRSGSLSSDEEKNSFNGRKASETESLEKPGASFSEYSVFDDPLLADRYMPPDSYEGKHRFDPNATWTDAEEKAIVRKCDLRVALFICLCFVCLQLDRGNIVNALSDGMLKDLGLTTDDYNHGQTIFYCSFLFAELPSQLISKKLGVDRWVPAQMIMWSIVAICQCRLNGKTSFFITRFLIGLIEGGFIPDAILYLSYFYTRAELPIRLSFFWVSLTSTTIIGNFLAAGILQMRGHPGPLGPEGWRYLFLIEGCLTLAFGVFAAFYFPPGPTETAGGIRGKNGWFTAREETIIVTRVLRDDHTKSDMHNREGLSARQLLRSLADYDHWMLYLLGLTTYMAPATITAYSSLIFRSLGFSTFKTNLLAIPGNFLFIVNNLALSFTSKRIKERTFVASIGSWWQLIILTALVAVPHASKWAKWALITLFLGYPYAHPILVAWNSNNSGSVRTRTTSASIYNMSVQLSSIIASNIYHKNDAPLYEKGNRVLLGIVSANICLFFLTKVYFILRNASKAKRWDAFTPEERAHYLDTTKDQGNRRLDFRFEH